MGRVSTGEGGGRLNERKRSIYLIRIRVFFSDPSGCKVQDPNDPNLINDEKDDLMYVAAGEDIATGAEDSRQEIRGNRVRVVS